MHEKYDPAVGNNYDVCMIRVKEDFVQRILDNGDELEIPCLGKFNQSNLFTSSVNKTVNDIHILNL